jgi:hypothetical protein
VKHDKNAKKRKQYTAETASLIFAPAEVSAFEILITLGYSGQQKFEKFGTVDGAVERYSAVHSNDLERAQKPNATASNQPASSRHVSRGQPGNGLDLSRRPRQFMLFSPCDNAEYLMDTTYEILKHATNSDVVRTCTIP